MKMKTVETTVANQRTWVRHHISTFLSIVNKDLQVKKMYLKQVVVIFGRGSYFEGVIL